MRRRRGTVQSLESRQELGNVEKMTV